jgi:hypothetical protein
MQKITKIAGAAGTKLRDRSRSVKLRLLEIRRVARAKGPINQVALNQRYGRCDEPGGGTCSANPASVIRQGLKLLWRRGHLDTSRARGSDPRWQVVTLLQHRRDFLSESH